MRRSSAGAQELKADGIKPLLADITKPNDLEKLPNDFDWVVNTVSSSKGALEEYEQVYLKGMRNLINRLRPQPPRKFVYTSSTSVYGQLDGSLVTEASVTDPASPTAQVLLKAERVLISEQRISAVILRVAGIYGPGRGYWLQQYLRGEASIAGGGTRILNMVHRDDVVGSILAALSGGKPGEIYNVVDDEPIAQIDLFRWLTATTGKAAPPTRGEVGAAHQKRALTNKKVSNQKLKTELGYRFKYPTFREGFMAEMKRAEL